jgi:hypothetical protein
MRGNKHRLDRPLERICVFSARGVDIHRPAPYSHTLMTSTGRSNFCRVIAAAGISLLIVSCAGTKAGKVKPAAEITKVKYYLLDPLAQNTQSADLAIPFERDHLLHGAITQADVIERTGHYYTIFWRAEDRSQPVKVRFEYRQRNTGLKVLTKEVEVSNIRRDNITKFQVTGSEFISMEELGKLSSELLARASRGRTGTLNEGGNRVTCFRVSLVRGKETLAEYRSFLWEKP